MDRDPLAATNVQTAIATALHRCQRNPRDVTCLVAGIAGVDSEADVAWADEVTRLAGLSCRRLHVNDAVIAHVGALQSRPGVIVISGTGSVIYAITESKRHIRNYDMQHYANSGARHLAFSALFAVLAGESTDADQPLVQQMLCHFSVESVAALRARFTNDNRGFTNADWPLLGTFAPFVTDAAQRGQPLAMRVSNAACAEIAMGVKLVGGHFGANTVSVSCVGSVIGSTYLYEGVRRLLEGTVGPKSYQLVPPGFSSTIGAVLMAFHEMGVNVSNTVLDNLRASNHSGLA